MPTKGTKAKKMKETINKGIINFKIEVSRIEIKTIINNAMSVKLNVLKKRNNNLYLVSHLLKKR